MTRNEMMQLAYAEMREVAKSLFTLMEEVRECESMDELQELLGTYLEVGQELDEQFRRADDLARKAQLETGAA